MMVITIDGPIASGKSTAARLLAQRIGFYHLSSGMLFRTLAYLLVKYAGYKEEKLSMPAQKDIEYYLNPARFICSFDDTGKLHVMFKEENIVPLLKQKQIDHYASLIATDAHVRQALLKLQHSLAQSNNLVVDGRDSGSIVFPNAAIKFFLTASIEVRALRWQQKHKKLGYDLSLQEAINQIESRDDRDKNRKISPLVIPNGAIVIDNSDYSIQETVDIMESFMHR
ncbi:(d)CMP kinase [Candidatus Dependentiae bacterium]|nr:MAG: (d)CMP kinase [Candidatus Dependentiae bacterium]